MEWHGMIRVLRLRRRDVGWAFLLGCFSWLVLTPVWIRATPGGVADRLIGGLFSPAYRVGKHLAHVVFPNSSIPNTTAYYVAPLIGVAGELLLLILLWLIGIGVVRWTQSPKPDGEIRKL